jgi:hypothetical protein
MGLHYIDLPSTKVIDDPDEYIQGLNLKECDILLLVAVHHDLLASAESLVRATGAKAVIAPIEDPTWVPPGLREQVKELLTEIGIESAFPKPFCTLEPGEGEFIDKFIERYRIGRPVCYADMNGDTITEIGPLRSAPCGCTWYVSQRVRGKSIGDPDELFDIIAKAHHSYPCTASMSKDREYDDALLHIAGYSARFAVCEAAGIEDCRTTGEKND